MNCSEAQTLLDLLSDGALDTKDTALVMQHTKECNACADEWNERESMRAQFRQLKEVVTLPVDARTRIGELISNDSQSRPKQHQLRLALPAIAAAVLVLGIVSMPKLSHINENKTLPTIAASVLVDDLNNPESAQPVANKESLASLLGYDLKFLSLPGWNMQRSSLYKNGATSTIARFDFARSTPTGEERMSCYQSYAGGISAQGAVDRKMVSGRQVAFGTRKDYNFAFWTKNGRDYLIVSALPQAALEAVIAKS